MKNGGVKGWRGVEIRDRGMMRCRDGERQGEGVVAMWGSDPVRRDPRLPTDSRYGRCGGAGRWQQRPSAGRAAGAVPAGASPRDGEAPRASPLLCGPRSALIPSGAAGRARGLRWRAEGLPLVQPSRGDAHGWSTDTDTGGSGCAELSGACPFPQLLHGWEFPAALAPRPSRNTCPSRGCKQRFSFLAVTAGFSESPALSVASFRCSWIVHFPTPLLHPDGAPRGGHREPATAAPAAPLGLMRVGTDLAMRSIHPSLTGATTVRGARNCWWGVRRYCSADLTTSRPALALGADGFIYGLGGKPEGFVKRPTSPGPAPARGSDTSQTRLWACEWSAMEDSPSGTRLSGVGCLGVDTAMSPLSHHSPYKPLSATSLSGHDPLVHEPPW